MIPFKVTHECACPTNEHVVETAGPMTDPDTGEPLHGPPYLFCPECGRPVLAPADNAPCPQREEQ
jgi:hypothetical protein